MNTRNIHMLLLALAVVGFFVGAVRADEESLVDDAKLDLNLNEAMADEEPFRLFPTLDITFIAGVWLPRLGGEVSLGPAVGSGPINIEGDIGFRDLEPTFRGELEISKVNTFELLFSGFDFSTEANDVFAGNAIFGDITLTPGTPYTGHFDISSFAAEIAVGVFQPFRDLLDTPIEFRVSPLFVARWTDIDVDVTAGATTSGGGGEFLGAMAGVRFEVDLYPKSEIFLISGLNLEASLAMGPALGGDGGFMWQVRAGLTAALTDNLHFTFGYRLLHLDVENGPFKYDGSLAGLFIGGSVTF